LPQRRVCHWRPKPERVYTGQHRGAIVEPPVLHLDDEYDDLRKDRDQIPITPPHHRLVVDEAIVWKLRQGREDALFAAVLEAGAVSGIISAMPMAMPFANVEQQRPASASASVAQV